MNPIFFRKVSHFVLGSMIVTMLFLISGCGSSTPATPTAPLTLMKLVDRPEYQLLMPEQLVPGRKYPLVMAFHPGGDVFEMMRLWKTPAARSQVFVYASKTSRNGMDMFTVASEQAQIAGDLLAEFPLDSRRVIATGLSGGGMVSHAFSCLFPDLIYGVIINTGMIHEIFQKDPAAYPKGKKAVFLASPTDFRYADMQNNKGFLEKLGWTVNWREFEGGHTNAPEALYEKAIQWMLEP